MILCILNKVHLVIFFIISQATAINQGVLQSLISHCQRCNNVFCMYDYKQYERLHHVVYISIPNRRFVYARMSFVFQHVSMWVGGVTTSLVDTAANNEALLHT